MSGKIDLFAEGGVDPALVLSWLVVLSMPVLIIVIGRHWLFVKLLVTALVLFSGISYVVVALSILPRNLELAREYERFAAEGCWLPDKWGGPSRYLPKEVFRDEAARKESKLTLTIEVLGLGTLLTGIGLGGAILLARQTRHAYLKGLGALSGLGSNL